MDGGTSIGLVYAPITLSNPRYEDVVPISVQALVDTGAMYSCIPEHLAIQLRLEPVDEREVTLADGSRKLCRYVGPVYLRFQKRGCFIGALVMGEHFVMGAIPMEDTDLVVLPLTRMVAPNPLSPNIPHGLV